MVKKPCARLCDSDPLVHLGIPNSEVKRQTGFHSQQSLLSYIFVVCNGDVEIVNHRLSSLTWYEEWFMHFEYQWGRTLARIEDVMAVFGLKCREANAIIESKYEQEFIVCFIHRRLDAKECQ